MKQAHVLCWTKRKPSVQSGLPAICDVKDCPWFATFQCLKFLDSKDSPHFLCSSLNYTNFVLEQKLILRDVSGPEVSRMTYSNLTGTATGRIFLFSRSLLPWPQLHAPLLAFQLLQSCSPVENQRHKPLLLKTFFLLFFPLWVSFIDFLLTVTLILM